MKTIFIGVGDYGVTNIPNTSLKTMALGSCVAVIFICPIHKVIGMVHIALPHSSINRELAEKKPGYFADTGIKKLITEMKKKNCLYANHLVVKIAGGASILDDRKIFNVGSRNVKAVKDILRKMNLKISGEDTGKNISRTVTVEHNSNKVILSSPVKGEWLI